MKSKKSTGELLHEIATTKQDFESFANENKDEFDEFDSRDYLNRLLNTKNLQPTDIIRRSGLERSYVYHILNGERKNPSQGKVIALCIAFELTVEQTQRLLRSWKLPVLYPRNQRDINKNPMRLCRAFWRNHKFLQAVRGTKSIF